MSGRMHDEDLDALRFAHGEMRAFSGVKEPTFRKWVGRGQLHVGVASESGRMRYSRRDLIYMRLLVTLTGECGVPIVRAAAVTEYALEWWVRMRANYWAAIDDEEARADLHPRFMQAVLVLPTEGQSLIAKTFDDLLDYLRTAPNPFLAFPLAPALMRATEELEKFEAQ